MRSLQATIWLLAILNLVQATPTPTARVFEPPGPLETNPAPDEITCSDYSTCSSKGLGYWTELQTTLAQPNPIDRTDGKAIFDRDYGCEFITLDYNNPDLQRIFPDLTAHGINPRWVEPHAVFSKNTEETAYTNLFQTNKGVILALENYRDADEAKTLQWSELMYQAWPYAQAWDEYRQEQGIYENHPGSGPISSFSTVIQVDVRNEESQAVLRTIWKAVGWEWNTLDHTWRKFTVEDPATSRWFYALLGTPNVKGTVYLLKDHAAEIGKKTVTEIWVRWGWVYPDIWINIGSGCQETGGWEGEESSSKRVCRRPG
ncbi:MAG: hypothetical protein Q9213_004439 [Squamulea squamosa]